MKKIIIAILCLAVVIAVAFFAGKNFRDAPTTEATVSTTQTIETRSQNIYLGYYKNKSFNPYKTNSPTNLQISTLLYDSLFIINDDFSSEPLLAQSIKIEDKQISVKIVDSVTFSNGASLTAYDVVYSFNLAKKSEHYKGRLTNITAAVAGTDTVTFTISSPDVYIQQCLTFPIIQNNTGNAALPVGSGRYVLRSIGGEYILSANPTNTRQETLATPTIGLTAINSDKDEIYRIHTGDISYYCDTMERGTFTKLNAIDVTLPTNNLIYIGYNSKNSLLASADVVSAIELAIDKNTLADTVFDNFCTLTQIPLNPVWYALEGLQLPEHEYNLIEAGNILDDCGILFSQTDKSHRYTTSGVFTLDILVNTESPTKVNCARLLGQALQNLGVKVTYSAYEFEDYIQSLKDGDFDLYIGEVSVSPNMDLSAFFKAGGSASYGISSKTVANAYNDFKTGSIDVNTFIRVFEEEKPFIPLCFRNYITYYSNEISFEGINNIYDPFKNIYSWKTADKTIK